MIYLFNNAEELIKIVPATALKSVVQKQTLTSERYVSDQLFVELSALSDNELAQLEYMALPDINDRRKFQLFFIVSDKTEHNLTELVGVQKGIEDLSKYPIYDIRPQNRSVREVAEQILQGTTWTVGYAPDIIRERLDCYYISAFDALKKMCEYYNVEMQFFVELNNNKIGNKYIEFKQAIGKNAGRRVVYGHNAVQIIKEVDKTDLYTALIGRGRGEEVSSADDNESGKAGYGRKINFADAVWTRGKNPVDKPQGQLYVELPEMTARYGVKTPQGNRPKIGFIEFDTDNVEDLLERTYQALVQSSRPQVELKTSSVYLKDTGIGDRVRVIRHDRQMEYEVRVHELSIDRLTGHCEIKLGDRVSDTQARTASRVSSQIVGLEEMMRKNFNQLLDYLPSANGFNRNWYKSGTPADPRIDDLWFKPDPSHEGHFIMMIWDGTQWVEILRSYGDTQVKDALGEVEKQATTLQKEIDAIKVIIDDASFDKTTIDDINKRTQKNSDNLQVIREIVGGDGRNVYNKNRATQTEGTIVLGGTDFEVGHNGDGFEVGKRYVISWRADCEQYATYEVTFNFRRTVDDKMTVLMQPTNKALSPQTQTFSDRTGKVSNVYPDTYQITVTSPLYKMLTTTLNVQRSVTQSATYRFKEVADGNLTHVYSGSWQQQPVLIFDGGGS